MIIGVAGLAVALAAGSIIFYMVLGLAVNRTLDDQARASASEVVALVNKGTPPDPLPISGAQVVQIIDRDHRVIGGSINADRLTPLLHPDELAAALQGSALVISGSRAGLTGPLRAVAETAGPGGAKVTVVVAQQVGDIQAGTELLRTALLIGAPLLLAALALIAWYVIGRTLRPVEALRQGAERISGGGHAEHLPVPQADDEIAALAITLNQMLDRLTAARARQGSFVADAAHELRSPLASIRVQLEVAQRVGDGGPLAEDLMIDIDRLWTLVEDLLLLARADADTRGPANPANFDAQTLLEQIAAERPPGRVPVHTDAGPPATVHADRNEIRRAIANLVDNAVRHADTGVQLRASATHDMVTIAVIDDGPGIDPADRQRVFHRFTRLDDARDRDAGGSGLGLAIAAEILRRAHGTVELTEPLSGKGLEARIGLPAAESSPRNGLPGPK
jgi:signal transduction histidine kinase